MKIGDRKRSAVDYNPPPAKASAHKRDLIGRTLIEGCGQRDDDRRENKNNNDPSKCRQCLVPLR
jgi:hypothetical protein